MIFNGNEMIIIMIINLMTIIIINIVIIIHIIILIIIIMTITVMVIILIAEMKIMISHAISLSGRIRQERASINIHHARLPWVFATAAN